MSAPRRLSMLVVSDQEVLIAESEYAPWSEPVRSTAPPLLESESQALEASASLKVAMPNWTGRPSEQFPTQEERVWRWTMSLNILMERRSHVASERAGRRASACVRVRRSARMPHDCHAEPMHAYLC